MLLNSVTLSNKSRNNLVWCDNFRNLKYSLISSLLHKLSFFFVISLFFYFFRLLVRLGNLWDDLAFKMADRRLLPFGKRNVIATVIAAEMHRYSFYCFRSYGGRGEKPAAGETNNESTLSSFFVKKKKKRKHTATEIRIQVC